MTQANELRVFISSTFRDFQVEREYLVKHIFPEIRALCRRRGVTFTDVDLRWGITQEEAEQQGIIRICLDEIDRCRPYFIGILGHRYGWTPPRSEIRQVAGNFSILAEGRMDEASITEMEIVHGVLANPAMAEHAFFYFRDPEATPPEFTDTDQVLVTRLNNLKDRIRESWFPVRENFSSPAELGRWLKDDLIQAIDRLFPESAAPGPLELERRAHRSFAASRTRAYIPNPDHLHRFDQWIGSLSAKDHPDQSSDSSSDQASGAPLVITGASGLGKSSLTAYLVDAYRTDNPSAFIVEHYVGGTAASGSSLAIMRHIIEEIRDRFSIPDEAPAKPDELEKSFPNWLFRADHYAQQSGTPVLIAVDAVNQLSEADQRLNWLPKVIPPSIHLLISTTPGTSGEWLAERGWNLLQVEPIDRDDVRRKIVLHYLREFRKSITAAQVARLTADEKATSPLYLRVVAEELRLHGEHETLDETIDRYAGAADILEVFDRVLERMERDYGAEQVAAVMRAIWASRSGLSERELTELTGISRLELSRLLFAMDYHFVQREGSLGFFHDYLRRGVQGRYLNDAELRRRTHLKLAHYFAEGEQSERSAREQLWGFWQAGDEDAVAETLSNPDRLTLLYTGSGEDDVLIHWTRLRSAGYDPEKMYSRSLTLQDADVEVRIATLTNVGHLLERLSEWDGAIETYRTLLELATAHKLPLYIARAEARLGQILRRRGAYAESLERMGRGLEWSRQQGSQNKAATSSILLNMGIVYVSLCEFDKAMEHFDDALHISEELNDPESIARAIGNKGVVYIHRGELDRAMECFREALRINEEIGNRYQSSSIIGNMGTIYGHKGQHEQALECFERQLRMVEELGNRSEASVSLLNAGIVYAQLGKKDKGLEYCERSLRICRELEDPGGIATALEVMESLR